MKRQIKFRVFNPQENQITNVRLCDYMGFHGIVYDGVGCNNSDNIWMQFTGLQDANGVDIYEGDQLLICAGYTSTVEFQDGMFVSVYSHPEDGETIPLLDAIGKDTIVVGDVF